MKFLYSLLVLLCIVQSIQCFTFKDVTPYGVNINDYPQEWVSQCRFHFYIYVNDTNTLDSQCTGSPGFDSCYALNPSLSNTEKILDLYFKPMVGAGNFTLSIKNSLTQTGTFNIPYNCRPGPAPFSSVTLNPTSQLLYTGGHMSGQARTMMVRVNGLGNTQANPPIQCTITGFICSVNYGIGNVYFLSYSVNPQTTVSSTVTLTITNTFNYTVYYSTTLTNFVNITGKTVSTSGIQYYPTSGPYNFPTVTFNATNIASTDFIKFKTSYSIAPQQTFLGRTINGTASSVMAVLPTKQTQSNYQPLYSNNGTNYQLLSSVLYNNTFTYNHSLTMYESVSMPSYSCNVKWNASFDPSTKITNGMWYEQTPVVYPLGFQSGRANNANYSLSAMYAKYSNQPSTTFYVEQGTGVLNSQYIWNYVNIISTDQEYSVLQQIDFFHIDKMRCLVRANITDNLAGFKSLRLFNMDTATMITGADLVQGTLLNGIYEKVIDYSQIAPSYFYWIDDLAINFRSFGDPFLPSLKPFPQLPLYARIFNGNSMVLPAGAFKSPFDFTHFSFLKASVDVSVPGVAVSNTLRFNMSNADTDLVPTLVLLYQSHRETFIGGWNTTTKLFTIDFTVNSNLFPGFVDYFLRVPPFVADSLGGGGYNQFSNYDVYSAFGDSSQIKVTCNTGSSNQIPPIITEITTSPPTSPVYITSSTPYLINYRLKIESGVSGFKNGTIVISSELNPVGYKFIIKKSDLDSQGYVNLNFTQFAICSSQTYTLSFVELWDNSNNYATTANELTTPSVDSPNQPVQVNPLYLFNGAYSLAIQCTWATPNYVSPKLVSFAMNTTTLDTGKGNRDFSVTFEIVDDIQLRQPSTQVPTVYITTVLGSLGGMIPFTPVAISTNTTYGKYTAVISVPYGYGLYGQLQVSIYGSMDVHTNLGGFSTYDIMQLGFEPRLNLTHTLGLPSINGVAYNTNTGSLTVYGAQFTNTMSLSIQNIPNGNDHTITFNYVNSAVVIASSVSEIMSQSSAYVYAKSFSNYVSNYYYFNITATPSSTTSSSSTSSTSSTTATSSTSTATTSTSNPTTSSTTTSTSSTGSTTNTTSTSTSSTTATSSTSSTTNTTSTSTSSTSTATVTSSTSSTSNTTSTSSTSSTSSSSTATVTTAQTTNVVPGDGSGSVSSSVILQQPFTVTLFIIVTSLFYMIF